MAGEVVITITGNLTSDPDVRETPTGVKVVSFSVASTTNTYESGSPRRKPTSFYRCTVWREQAVNVAASLRKADRVILTGALEIRPANNGEGEVRAEVEVAEIGASLRYAQADIDRAARGT